MKTAGNIVVAIGGLLLFSTRTTKPKQADSPFLDLSDFLDTEQEAEEDDHHKNLRSIFSLFRHETTAPSFHHWYEDERIAAAATTTHRKDEGVLQAATTTKTQDEQQRRPRLIPSKSAFLQSIVHEELFLASRRQQQQQQQHGNSVPRMPFVHDHYPWWFCSGLMTTILCGLWLAQQQYKRRRNQHPPAESFASSSSDSFPERRSISGLSPTCFAFVASSCIAHFPTTFEKLHDLFSWPGCRQPPEQQQQQNVQEECTSREKQCASDSPGNGLCASGDYTDDTEVTMCSDGSDDDEETTDTGLFATFSDDTIAWIANHIERNDTIHNTSVVDRETPVTGEAINFFHDFRFDKAGTE
jgi:hypothetical protein